MCASQWMAVHTLLEFGNELLGKNVISYRTYGAEDKNEEVIRSNHPDICQ